MNYNTGGVKYDKPVDIWKLAALLNEYADYQRECRASGIDDVLIKTAKTLEKSIDTMMNLEQNKKLLDMEPDSLSDIKKLRPNGPRKMIKEIPLDYESRLSGAFHSRIAGCLLGSIVEGQTIENMKAWANKIGDNFPPDDYWSKAPAFPGTLRYWMSPVEDFTRGEMDHVPVDDDIIYTLVGLLVLEEYGIDFTTTQLGEWWNKKIPYGYTAEEAALNNLKAGAKGKEAAVKNNPYWNWIGADIRSDPWAYVCPGWTEKAAEFAWRDAMLTHRRTGVFGAMYFSAVQAAAFCVDDAMKALEIGLTEIPENCWLANEIKWALDIAPTVSDYEKARALVDERYPNMPIAHTINNACLTIFGIQIGNGDVTKTISNLIAMGLDNDCTAATAGSIVGAVSGIENVQEHWYKPFNNRLRSYIKGQEWFEIDDILKRFKAQSKIIRNS